MLISSKVWEALADAGLHVVPADASHLEVALGGDRFRLFVHASARPMTPSRIDRMVRQRHDSGILVVPAATQAARRVVERAGWSWLVIDGDHVHGMLILGSHKVTVHTPSGPAKPAARSRLTGALTVARWLLQRPAATQTTLAQGVGISQPRVSQILSEFTDREFVRRDDAGWVVADFDGLLDWWLDAYPGPGGISTLWYGLDSVTSQAKATVDILAVGKRGAAVVSGDVAADAIAPWRAPTFAVVYGHSGVDLSSIGLVAADVEEATLELIVPVDQTVFWSPLMPVGAASIPLADPIQVLWDVWRGVGPDCLEAADRLRGAIRSSASGASSRALN